MRLRVVFFGSPDFAVPSLEAVAADHEVVAVLTQPDRPSGRGKHLAPPAVKELALRLGMPVLQPDHLKGSDIAERLSALRPDVFVVVAYGRILPQTLLQVPPLGPWNVHASLLPRYRGAAPIQWAIICGETRTGVCVMRMEAGLDTGPVAACTEAAIGEDDTAATLSGRLAPLGAALLARTLPGIAAGTVAPEPQDHSAATLARILKKEDGLLDFRATAAQVAARARGVDPWPGPAAFLGGEPIKLFAPRVVAGAGESGQMLGCTADGLVVACAAGAVAFRELQLPGRKRLPAAAVLAGMRLTSGARLTSTPMPGDRP